MLQGFEPIDPNHAELPALFVGLLAEMDPEVAAKVCADLGRGFPAQEIARQVADDHPDVAEDPGFARILELLESGVIG
jgi:hypothetical protein